RFSAVCVSQPELVLMVEEALAAADKHHASLRSQVTLLKQSHAAAQAEIARLRREMQRSVPPISQFPHRQRPESYYVGDAHDPDMDGSSTSSELREEASPRSCARDVPTANSIGDSDWISLDMVATLVAGPQVSRIGVGFLNLPPVPLVVKRVTRGSWAERQGIRCGDEFMSVDHKRSRAFTASEFLETMKKRPLFIKLRRTVRKDGAEEGGLMELRGFGAEAENAERSSEEEEEDEEEEESESEEMCPEKAKEVAKKLAQEVEDNARKDEERRRRKSSDDLEIPSQDQVRRHSTGNAEAVRDTRPMDPARPGEVEEDRHELKEPLEVSPSTAETSCGTSIESTPTDSFGAVRPEKPDTEDEFF
ncbi:unnamed protein product, partial [Effrenium voratum]